MSKSETRRWRKIAKHPAHDFGPVWADEGWARIWSASFNHKMGPKPSRLDNFFAWAVFSGRTPLATGWHYKLQGAKNEAEAALSVLTPVAPPASDAGAAAERCR